MSLFRRFRFSVYLLPILLICIVGLLILLSPPLSIQKNYQSFASTSDEETEDDGDGDTGDGIEEPPPVEEPAPVEEPPPADDFTTQPVEPSEPVEPQVPPDCAITSSAVSVTMEDCPPPPLDNGNCGIIACCDIYISEPGGIFPNPQIDPLTCEPICIAPDIYPPQVDPVTCEPICPDPIGDPIARPAPCDPTNPTPYPTSPYPYNPHDICTIVPEWCPSQTSPYPTPSPFPTSPTPSPTPSPFPTSPYPSPW